ncbi:MAG: oligoendopeptidase F, partial [Clostridia bacterium]|nr:oligoendopeptidase F [Clostridia bacterium]
IFGKIDNADLKFGTVRVGFKKIPLTHGTYGLMMHSDNRRLREKAFKQYYKSYIDFINTISATYYGNVKKGVCVAKARNYDSALARALGGEDVDVKVYQNLIESVNTALPILHDYMATKKKQLGYKQMHMYDVYASTVKDADYKLNYDDAYSLVVEGLSVLGEEYKELLLKAYNERWIDVDEKPNKRSGAYSISAYDTHPYVLLNYQPTTHDVFTIAHEMGHSIHSYYSNKTQPYAKADYKIFVAEVASTVNEVLLVKYLISKAKDKKQEKFLLSYLMEMIRTTLFRQTQFAEFEEFSHSSVEKGIPLTKDLMNEKYLELNKKYYGDAVVSDTEISYEWARIPHFYRAFYVYKYSTGIISALAIAERILNEGQPAINDYFNFLKSGNSNGPVELLKIAGVDLTDKKPFELAFKTFSDALNRFKQL